MHARQTPRQLQRNKKASCFFFCAFTSKLFSAILCHTAIAPSQYAVLPVIFIIMKGCNFNVFNAVIRCPCSFRMLQHVESDHRLLIWTALTLSLLTLSTHLQRERVKASGALIRMYAYAGYRKDNRKLSNMMRNIMRPRTCIMSVNLFRAVKLSSLSSVCISV